MLEPVSDFESRILELAQRRGILSASDLDCPLEDLAELGSLSWGPRITALIHKGRLDHATVRALTLELIQTQMLTSTTQHGEDSVTDTPQESSLNWSGYTDLQPIAMGGGGMVYRAKDPRLDRWVALKFPRNDQPDRVKWMLREARAQAKVDHPHVAKVHEVGEHEGQPFIAMQLVQGGTLREVHSQLRLEQKVILMMQVAEGLHAAHRKGLLHQDIKPANILVETKEDGTPWPFITDFGLVCREDAKGTIAYFGSPPYSSPEQMAGYQERLDRRSDVFSLGATLYYALVGVPPFDTTDPNVLANATPIPLCARDSQMPADLEAIADKCIRRNCAERYDSAHAVAEDLRRFLEGKPVEARNPTWRYRAHKFVQRHRAIVIVGAFASCLVLGVGLWAVLAARRTEKRNRLAANYEQQIQTVENQLRFAHLSMHHDRRSSVKAVRQAMENIKRDMASLGADAIGPGSYALGQGHLLLNEVEEAQRFLDRAWAVNFRTPACALARAQVLIELLNWKKSNIAADNPSVLQASLQQLDLRYRMPAIECLRIAQNASINTPYSRALDAYVNGNPVKAIQEAEVSGQQAPWMYEAYRLQAKIYRELARAARNDGKLDEAIQHHQAAIRCLDKAIEQGHGDPYNWLEKGGNYFRLYRDVPFEKAEPWMQKAINSLNAALLADPTCYQAYETLSDIYYQHGQRSRSAGVDPMTYFDQAVAYGELAQKELKPGFYSYYLGQALAVRSEERYLRGEDARTDLDQAISLMRKTINRPGYENPHYNYSLGSVLLRRYNVAYHMNEESISFLREASHLFSDAKKNDPTNPAFILQDLETRFKLFSSEKYSNLPVSESLDHLIFDLIAATQRPNMKVTYVANIYRMLGWAYTERAEEASAENTNPASDFTSGRQCYEKAIMLEPNNPKWKKYFCEWIFAYHKWLTKNGRDSEKLLLEGLSIARKLRQYPIDTGWMLEPIFELFIAHHRKEERAINKAEKNIQKFVIQYPQFIKQIQENLPDQYKTLIDPKLNQ